MKHMKNKAYKDMCATASVVWTLGNKPAKLDDLLKLTGLTNKAFMDRYFAFLDKPYDTQYYLPTDTPLSIFGGVMESLLAFTMLFTYDFIWTPQRCWVRKRGEKGKKGESDGEQSGKRIRYSIKRVRDTKKST